MAARGVSSCQIESISGPISALSVARSGFASGPYSLNSLSSSAMSAVMRLTYPLVRSKEVRVEANSRASTSADMVAISATDSLITSLESPVR